MGLFDYQSQNNRGLPEEQYGVLCSHTVNPCYKRYFVKNGDDLLPMHYLEAVRIKRFRFTVYPYGVDNPRTTRGESETKVNRRTPTLATR